MKRVKELLPDSPPHFDQGPVDGQAGAFFVTEIIREKILLYYDKETLISVEVMVATVGVRQEDSYQCRNLCGA